MPHYSLLFTLSNSGGFAMALRVLHTNARPETAEGGSSGAIWKNYRVLSADEEICLASQRQVQPSMSL
jgi:hypothetical protein